ncbi:MAG TPA: hypothetical protein VKZ18_10860 [Polyangia bacterium]|nr:hypothetical protein [Polyangia bacterium]
MRRGEQTAEEMTEQTTMTGGIFGRAFVDLEPYVDLDELAALDDEITLGLTEVPVSYTGGSHKWMGIVPPSTEDDRYVDYGQVIAGMSRSEFGRFVALSDTPEAFDLDRRQRYEFGEERPWPLSRRQMLYLEYRHGVYFPWKVYYELCPNLVWEERAAGAGKAFTDEARRVFPRTIAFIERLPFLHIGRCNLLGLQSNDHGTIHRDGEDEAAVGHFVTLCPRGDKRLFLWDEERRRALPVPGRAYWFDDRNYHGVAADPFFRYSIRVDGVFRPDFLARLEGDLRGAA